MTSEVKLKTGGDPRSLPDYAALRDEISKLTHPARPDVDWRYVETLCLRLYEHNGVELQTASWYTIGKRLVRTVLIFTESSDQLSRATDRVP
uniref:type VI secretion system ImpA family N-terminal domain-containing protein n=1 Tax=Escherichia coli TaxID=562 RepID=UPI00208DD82E